MSNDSIQKKLSKIRDYFPLLKNYTFINSASHPPLGLPIRKRLDEFYDLMQDTPFDKDEFIFEFIESARKKVAKMFNCEPDEIAITPSTSYGINIAAFGVLKPGDTVLLPENEFPTNVFPFMNLKNNGVNVKFLKCPEGYATLDDIDSNLTPDVKLFSISWVQFYNGVRNDIKAISELCKQKGVFFSVDGMQGAGNIPLDLPEAGVDLFASGASKWFLTPCGTGFCYLAKNSDDKIKQHYSGWLAVDWSGEFTSVFDFERPFKKGAPRLEIGTYPYQEIAAFDAALDILLDVGVENIFKHNVSLVDRLLDFLKHSNFYQINSSLETPKRSSIISVKCDEVEKLNTFLTERKIIISLREGGIRISPHLYNNTDDIDCLIEALLQFEKEKHGK